MASVQDFLSSIGVNTHMDATASPYGNVAMVEKDLAYIGVTQIRDHAWDTDLPAYRALATKGIKFDLIVDDSPSTAVAAMIPIKSDILSFEGVNEVDITPITYPGARGDVAAAVAEQKALYTAVKSTPALSAIPVLNESIGDSNNYAEFAATTAYSDITNIHAYAAWGDTPQIAIPPRVQSESTASKPTVITETGYFTLLNNAPDPSGVTEAVQARYTLDTLFDDFSLGVSKTYLYELLDEGDDPAGTNAELHYGLFHADGTPKLAATAIHNLDAILATPGVAGSVPLTPSLVGLPGNGRSVDLTGSDGATFIAVWAEPQIWDTDAQKELSAPATQITVNLGKTVASVEVFDPLVGTNPIATYTDVSSLGITITDHPLIIEASGVAVSNTLVAEARVAPIGSTIIDARSPVLVGNPVATDAFFVDATASRTTASTIVNFHHGDTVTLWGFVDGVSTLSWKGHQTVNGYTGATLHTELAGTTAGATASLTLAGFSLREVHSQIAVSTGTSNGVSYLRLTDNG